MHFNTAISHTWGLNSGCSCYTDTSVVASTYPVVEGRLATDPSFVDRQGCSDPPCYFPSGYIADNSGHLDTFISFTGFQSYS